MGKLSSGVWGNKSYEISQGFGVYNASTAHMYSYAAGLGWPEGTHVGVDVAMPRGTPIYAAADGVVSQAGPSRYFRPNPIWIEASDNPSTVARDAEIHVYGHLWENTVDVGQAVQRGELIGYSGEQTTPGTLTPDGTGPHIHFERRNDDNTQALDPVPLLKGTTAASKQQTDASADGQADQAAAKSLTDRAAAAGGRIGLGIVGLVLLALALLLASGKSPIDLVPAARIARAVAR